MVKTKAMLGLDMGTSSCKAILLDDQMRTVTTSFCSYGLKIEDQGGAEQNPDEWWNAIKSCVNDIKSRAVDYRIVSIGVTGQWSGTVPVDSDGKALHNAIIWMDTRGSREVEELTGGFPSISGYRIDKLYKWLHLTGGAPGHSGKDTIAHILFIRDNMQEIYRNTYKFLEPKDYINMRLTGSFKTTWDTATLMWSSDSRNPNKIEYSDSLIRMNKLDPDKLPEMVRAVDIIGKLTPDTASDLGLPEDIDVIGGCGDTQCSLLGGGCIDHFSTLLYLGTSSWITAHVARKKTDIMHNIAALPSALEGKYFIAAEQENASSCMEYISGILGITGNNKYDTIDKMVSSSPPGSNGLIYLPWVYGERAPVEDSLLRGGFFNLSLGHGREDIIRSVMEGVAFNSKWLLGIVDKFLGNGNIPNRIIMSGGGALSSVWPQILSDVLEREISVIPDPRYSTVRGVALLAGVGSGLISMDDLKTVSGNPAVYRPNVNNFTVYRKNFEEFIDYYRNNRKSMHRINAIK